MVMGGDSYSKGREFESRHHILDGHFFTYLFVVKCTQSTCLFLDSNNDPELIMMTYLGLADFLIKKHTIYFKNIVILVAQTVFHLPVVGSEISLNCIHVWIEKNLSFCSKFRRVIRFRSSIMGRKLWVRLGGI